ncbi:hypothetical protein [Mesorhizobium sp.]|uniref:hypothetical protein n=1 Tax=Mesorhizobium sp. TaxID=1871066 RepID=UPI00120701E6|nr:hypothetical protein [Mesorhizobium sp.]TIO72143.1 MAG: hypothetical protein E5X75_33615 [Mesorhizobium sp.]
MIRDQEDFQRAVERRRKKRMAKIDALSPELRSLVHEYGYHIVNQFMMNGVTSPRLIRHLVEIVLDEFSPTRGSFSVQGIRTVHADAKSSEAAE